ncbi:MAG: Fidgetin-like protein 1, partial [Marteilia pararefringens]
RTTEGHEREYEILNDFLNNSTNIATDVLCESNHVNSSNNECSSQIESLNEMYKLLHVLGSRTDSSDPKQSKCSNFINYTEELIFDAIDDIYDESNEDGIDINIAQNLSQFFSQKKFKRKSSNIQSDRLHRVFNAKSYSSNFDRISLSTSAVSLELDSRNKISELEIPNENILQEFCQRFVKNQNIKKSTHDSTKGYENKKNKLCITASDKDIPIPKSDLKASVRNSNLRYKALVHNKKALSDDEDDGSGNSDYYNRKHGLGRWRSTFIRTKQLKQNAKQQKMNIDEIESSYIDQEDLHVNRKTRNAENNDRSLKRKSKINIFNPPSAISKQKIIETSSFRTALDELTSNDDLDLKRDENKTNVESCSKPNPSTMSAKSIVKKFQSPMAKIDEEKTLGDENKSDKNSITSNLEIFKGIDQHLIDIIISEIVDDGPKIAFEDIAGLEFAKKTIKEIVIWPMLRP